MNSQSTALHLVDKLLEAEENIDWSPDPEAERLPETVGLPFWDEVRFSVEPEEEEMDFHGYYKSDEPESDRQLERWIERQLEMGNQWAWCSVRLTASWTDRFHRKWSGEFGDKEYEGIDYIGGCSYKNERDFLKGGYYEQMCEDAYEHLVRKVAYTKNLESGVAKFLEQHKARRAAEKEWKQKKRKKRK